MYGKPAMTCFKYQVYLYMCMVQKPSHISVLYFEWLQSQHYESSDCPHPPLQAALPQGLAAKPSPILKRTLVRLNYYTYVKSQRENLFGWGTITCQTAIPIPVCKIWLKGPIQQGCESRRQTISSISRPTFREI
jgi:hypothetical protein